MGADGSRSIVRKILNNKDIPLMNGVQFLMDKKNIDDNYVKIFLDRKYSSDFFAWVVPRKEDMLVGLSTYDQNPLPRLNKLVEEIFPDVRKRDVIAGQIPVGFLKNHTSGNIYLTGDAAVFVKATSGGGLYYGLMGSEILAKSIIHGYVYEDQLSQIMHELKIDYFIHKIFSKLGDVEISKLMDRLKNERIIEMINEYGDIDRPSILAKKLALEPSLIPFFISLGSKFFKFFL